MQADVAGVSPILVPMWDGEPSLCAPMGGLSTHQVIHSGVERGGHHELLRVHRLELLDVPLVLQDVCCKKRVRCNMLYYVAT